MIDEAGPRATIRTSRDARVIASWSLVLVALGIEHEALDGPEGLHLLVAPEDEARARAALDAHDREAREEAATSDPVAPDRGRSLAGIVVAAGLLAFFYVTGERSGRDAAHWFRDGSAIAERIVGGELARAITALTLHADLSHVAGNAAAAALFLGALGRWIGGGLASLLVLLAGAGGNVIVAYYRWSQGAQHNSVGASTATFAALGLLGGLQFARWFAAGPVRMRRRRAYLAVAACVGIFAMLGVSERSDVLAHVSGLVLGLGAGGVLGATLRRREAPSWVSPAAGVLAGALVIGAWVVARG